MPRIKSEINPLFSNGDMVTKGEPLGKKKIRTVLILALLVALIVLATSIFVILSSSHSQVSTPTVANIKQVTPHYLPYNGNESRIFLVSATPTYGSYPGPSVPKMGNTPGVKKGEPCFIINVTVRDDYSAENPPPYQNIVNVSNPNAYVFLTAQIFNTQGQINATDVTPPYPPVPFSGAYASLASGENATVTIYLATNHQDIDRFEIILEYVGSLPPP